MRDFGTPAAERAPHGRARATSSGRRADGSLFDAEASISHVELDGLRYFAAIVRDVSETRQTHEERWRAARRVSATLAESAPVGIFQTDARAIASTSTNAGPTWPACA